MKPRCALSGERESSLGYSVECISGVASIRLLLLARLAMCGRTLLPSRRRHVRVARRRQAAHNHPPSPNEARPNEHQRAIKEDWVVSLKL